MLKKYISMLFLIDIVRSIGSKVSSHQNKPVTWFLVEISVVNMALLSHTFAHFKVSTL